MASEIFRARLGRRTFYRGHAALIILDAHLDGLSGLDFGVEADRNPGMLPTVIRFGGGEEFCWNGRFLPDTEHMLARLVPKVAVREALAGKGLLQRPLFPAGGIAALPDGAGINLCDHGHILRPLHASLDFGAGNAHLLQLPQVLGQRHVLQGEQRLLSHRAPAVVEPAGLSAHAPVAASAADDGGEEALT